MIQITSPIAKFKDGATGEVESFAPVTGDVGAKGETGDQGQRGDTGAVPNINLVAEELDVSTASVEITGTAENPTMKLGLPKGDTGEVTGNEANMALGNKAKAVIKTASGSDITFTDGSDNELIKEMTVQIVPEQDLNGYDNPWTGGGGKNLFNINGAYEADIFINNNGQRVNSWDGQDNPMHINLYTTPIPVQANTQYILSGTCSSETYLRVIEYTSDDVFIGRYVSSKVKNPSITFTTTANTAYVLVNPNTNVTNIQLELGSAKTDFEPYENICDINGYTSTTVCRYGANTFDFDSANWKNKYTLDSNGEETSGSNYKYSQTYYAIKPSTDYFASFRKVSILSAGFQVCLYDENKTFISKITIKSNTTAQGTFSGRFTTTADTYFYRVTTVYSKNAGMTGSEDIYVAEEIIKTYDFPQSAGTVYGGNLVIHDDGTGTLTVTHKTKTFTSADNWHTANGVFYINKSLEEFLAYDGVTGDWLCNKYSFNGYAGTTTAAYNRGYGFYRNNNTLAQYGKRVFIVDDNYPTVEDFKTSLVNSPLVVYGILETPEVYQLTSQQVIRTLLGINRFFATTGDVSVQYKVDFKSYIDNAITKSSSIIAGVETDFVATKNYSIGDLFIVNDGLYKATSAITNGSAITVGTNCITTTVTSVLKEIIN